ncbi:hypothetical protein AAC387_Pa02g0254 [Persea americana]
MHLFCARFCNFVQPFLYIGGASSSIIIRRSFLMVIRCSILSTGVGSSLWGFVGQVQQPSDSVGRWKMEDGRGRGRGRDGERRGHLRRRAAGKRQRVGEKEGQGEREKQRLEGFWARAGGG